MPAHTHVPIRKAIFIVLLLATFAWLTFMVSDTRSAAPETAAPAGSTHPVEVPGSSLEGINEPLSAVIAWNTAVRANEVAAEAARAAQEAAQAASRAAQPAQTSTPVVRSAPTTQCPADIVALIHKHWDRFGVDVANWAVNIAWRESNCRPDVTSPTRCAGLFQLAVPLHGDLFAAAGYDWRTAAWEAEPNIVVAANLYASSGSSPWRL